MKFLILIPILFMVGLVPAFADPFPFVEKGSNYDRQIIAYNPDGSAIVKWTSKPERLEIAPNQYIDYKLTETESTITYESKGVTTRFYKDTSSFNIYDSGFISSGEKAVISSISHTVKEAEDGTNVWQALQINRDDTEWVVSETDDAVIVTARKDARNILGMGGLFDVIYEIDTFGKLKWSYEYGNFDPLKNDRKYGFTTVFDGGFVVDIADKRYDTRLIQDEISITANDLKDNMIKISNGDFEVYFDTQNYSHDYLWVIKIQNNKVIFDFTYSKGKLQYGETLRVDPTFGYTTGTMGTPRSTAATGAACPGAPYDDPADGIIQVPRSTDAATCRRNDIQWDTSSVPDTALPVSGTIRYDITAVGANPRNCDWNSIEFQPSTRTVAQRFADIADGTTYLSNNADCTTAANDKTWTLPAAALTDIQSKLSADWWAIGVLHTDQTRDADAHDQTFSNVELTFVYVSGPPNPASGFSATSQARKVQYNWSQTNGTGITTYYLGRSLDNSTWPQVNKTSTGNVTSYLDSAVYRAGLLYYVNITANNGLNSTAVYSSFTMDNIPSVPLNPYTTPLSDTSIKLNWSPPSSTGNDPITGYRIEYCIACSSWTLLVNQTNTLNYNQTGLTGSPTVKYRMAAWNGVGISTYTANFTGTPFKTTTGTLTLTNGVVGDTIQVNSTISITQASPSPVTVSQLKLYRNGSLVETKNVSVQIAQGSSSSSFDPFWNRMLTGGTFSFKMYATISNSTGTVQFASSNFTASRQYEPEYFNALTDPGTEGQVNYTMSRFDDEDGIYLRVNRQSGSLGSTWEINCISQTNSEAGSTRNQSLNWPGTWRNYSNVGYFNSTWTDFRNSHGYITCFNPPGILFTTTSYTNSSLALFGIQIFDDSYGAMLGVPVGIFFLAMAGSMANKRTAPTWIIVVLAMAGTMAAIGFFTLNPLVWGLALVTGLLGVLVNQKVF